MTKPTHKETYEYCEKLIRNELANKISRSAHLEKNAVDEVFNDEDKLMSLMNEIGGLYKHLENLQSMKTSYLSGR